MKLFWKLVFIFLYCSFNSLAVDKNNFKSCEQSSFCRRLRKENSDLDYQINPETIQIAENSVEAELFDAKSPSAHLKFLLVPIQGNVFRILIDEVKPLHTRYRPQFSLNGEPQVARLKVLDKNKDSISVKYANNKAVIYTYPFKIEFYTNDVLVSIVNGEGLFNFEQFKTKSEQDDNTEQAAIKEDPGAWGENFKSHHDSKPKGPAAIGMDIVFPGAKRLYGLPEHADQLSLRTTGPGGLDPYRLYNLDVFQYELDSTMSLYGAIPVVYAHSDKYTVGAFWHNAAETWVDVKNSKDTNVMSSIVNLVSRNKLESSVNVHFMSETGVLDLFILMGPTPKECVRQYASLTGVAPLPQYYTLAYHQCRWNYNDEDDVTNVIYNFDLNDIQVDTIWLDIEYTDGKKYFTWDPVKFPHPELMINNLTSTGRKLIVIIDPHIKRESGYFLHEDSLANDYYVKTKDGNVYEGWCWPGSSSYLDFYNPEVMKYYGGLYALDKFKGTTHDVNIWNDMNEPSVFNGPEVTMPKDCIHYGGWEHRDVHNEYALTNTIATFRGLLDRSPNKRPFILTRGHFSGSQRVAAVWTGDNIAEWSHLAISYPMCLSEALGGISFCGADIGGFFNNPNVDLLQRWYQAAIWLPFFRSHAHIDTRRREPYLFGDDVRNRIRSALRLRYAHLPLWYTLFWEHQLNGDPVIRPLFYEFPEDENVIDIDSELMVGNSILARVIAEPDISMVNVYLPGGSTQYWYDIEDFKQYPGAGNFNIPVSLDKIVAFYKGGTIISRKDRPRRSSALMRNDPFTLYVALNNENSASGTLYLDDNESFEYKNNKYLYVHFQFADNTLTSKLIDKTDYPSIEWIERVIIFTAPRGIKSAKLTSKSLGTITLETFYNNEDKSLIIRKPGVSIRESFTIQLI